MVSFLLALIACQDEPPTTPTTPTSPTTVPGEGVCAGNAGATLCDGNAVVTCDADAQIASTVPCEVGQTCADAACVACTPATLFDVPGSNPDVVAAIGVRLDVDSAPDAATRLPFLRPVDLLAASTVSVSGPVELLDSSGVPISNGTALPANTRVLLRATALGDAALVVDDGVCATSLPLEPALPAPLVGRPLDGFPWFETVRMFVAEDDAVSVLVDPYAYADRVGVPFDAYVVEPRTPEEWSVSRNFLPIAGPVAGVVPEAGAEALPLWPDPAPPGAWAAYSVVIDFDRNGQLDPGDLVDGYDAPGFTVAGDLGALGPYTTVREEVTFDFWHTFLVYWPDELEFLEPLPVVVISHGNGHQYTWYDFLGNHLSSHGYAVIVHRNDTADTSIIPAANTTWQNTDLFLGNLATEVGGQLDGEIDTHRIAFIGHSRGGEGVVIAYNGLVKGLITPANFTAQDVVLVSSIAPTVWTSPESADPNDVIYHQMNGSSDGDVTGSVSNGIGQYFRIFQGATNVSALTYVQGATHNDFNCCGFDDGAGVGGFKIGRGPAQQIAKSYYLALLRAVFDGDDTMWEFFSRNPERFRPAGVETPVTTMLLAGDSDPKVVIDDFQSAGELNVASSGGAVAYTTEGGAEGALQDGDDVLSPSQSDPFNGASWVEPFDTRPDRGLALEWPDGSELSWEVAVPAGEEDWRDDAILSLRVAQSTRHPYTLALAGQLSFTIEAEDAAGNTSPIDFRVYGGVNPPYPRDGDGTGVGWVDEFQTVRIPVADFARDGTVIDLSQITTLRFRFGAANGSSQGRVIIDDIELLKEVVP